MIDKPKAIPLNISDLKPHELTEPRRLAGLLEEIKRDGVLKRAIAVDRETLIILDGHHRVECLKMLGCDLVYACLFDYRSPDIIPFRWDGDGILMKEDILDAGLRGRPMPPRSSRHMVKLGSNLVHISELEEVVNVPLKNLKRGAEINL